MHCVSQSFVMELYFKAYIRYLFLTNFDRSLMVYATPQFPARGALA